jgi:hypothetical protein
MGCVSGSGRRPGTTPVSRGPVSRRMVLGLAAGTAGVAAVGAGARGADAQLVDAVWLLPRSAWGNLTNVELGGDPQVCQRAFNQGTTWFSTNYQGAGPDTKNPIPSGYSGVGVLKFQAYQNGSLGLVDAIAAGLPAWVQAVQYDSEYWSATPPIEQGAWLYNDDTQTSYAQQFCATAHAHGLAVVLSPGNDLCNNHPNPAYPDQAPQYPVAAGEADYQAYVRYGLASAAAWLSPGDVYEYQAQKLELDTTTYQQVTTQVAGQVAAAARGVSVLAGIGRTGSTADGATCDQLTAAADSVASVVSGYWPNVDADTSRVTAMICLLHALGY